MSALAAALPRPSAGRLGRLLLITVLLAASLAAVYLFWARDAPMFAVDEVRVEGIGRDSPGGEELRRSLVEAGREMTTLHVRPDLLREAAAGFPLVASVSAEADFPDGLTVRVAERRPVAVLGDGAGAVVVAGDGTLLRGLAAEEAELPRLSAANAPRRERLAGPLLGEAQILGAAPAALLAHVDGIVTDSRGAVVTLDNGIELLFGVPSREREKWQAAAAVLADPSLTALDYVDLTSPRRVAVGGVGDYLPVGP
jgi:cell division protein FtsQ